MCCIARWFRITREENFICKINSLGKNIKILFNLLNSLMNRNKVQDCIDDVNLYGSKLTEKQLISDTFNNYFAERPNNIHACIPNSASPYHYLIPTNDTTTPFFHATAKDFCCRAEKLYLLGSILLALYFYVHKNRFDYLIAETKNQISFSMENIS